MAQLRRALHRLPEVCLLNHFRLLAIQLKPRHLWMRLIGRINDRNSDSFSYHGTHRPTRHPINHEAAELPRRSGAGSSSIQLFLALLQLHFFHLFPATKLHSAFPDRPAPPLPASLRRRHPARFHPDFFPLFFSSLRPADFIQLHCPVTGSLSL